MKKVVDTRSRICPEPLIMTRRAIKESQPSDIIEVLIDNEAARANISAYLRQLGIIFEDSVDGIRFTSDGELPPASPSEFECECGQNLDKSRIIVIKSLRMGEGDAELGELLMRAFVNSLTEAEILPGRIILYNEGVKTAVSGTDTAAAYSTLNNKGVEFILCGTCVDYYGCGDSLAVGSISNMYSIQKMLATAKSIIYP